MESAPNARARFSCKGKVYCRWLPMVFCEAFFEGKIVKNSCQSEGLYMKDRFCYHKENRQLQIKC